jgi:hypothetical protein
MKVGAAGNAYLWFFEFPFTYQWQLKIYIILKKVPLTWLVAWFSFTQMCFSLLA